MPLVQAIVRLPKDCPVDTTRVWFVPDDTPYFYWLIPESSERAALGIIGEGADTKKRLARFLEKKEWSRSSGRARRFRSIANGFPVKRRVGNGDVYLVGDAAAQVKVTTVGGIVTGFRGAIGVAQSILRDGASRELRTLRRELDTHWLIRRTMHHFQQKDYSHLVDLMNIATKNTLSEITRDESANFCGRFCAANLAWLCWASAGCYSDETQRRHPPTYPPQAHPVKSSPLTVTLGTPGTFPEPLFPSQ